jgi:hypothetical protein
MQQIGTACPRQGPKATDVTPQNTARHRSRAPATASWSHYVADSPRNADGKNCECAELNVYGLRAEAGLGVACFFWKSLITAIFCRKI